jgi:hypothetical protein
MTAGARETTIAAAVQLQSFAWSYLDADGTGGDVPDNSGLSVVELVRQTLLHGSVTLDIHELHNSETECSE